MRKDLPLTVTLEVRDRCLCLRANRAARVLSRRFDEAFRPFGITNGQYSLMVALNRPDAPRLGDLARFLAMDRTTLTASLKPLERRGLVAVEIDPADRRGRRLKLTKTGQSLLVKAVPVWRATHDEVDALLSGGMPEQLRTGLAAVSSALQAATPGG